MPNDSAPTTSTPPVLAPEPAAAMKGLYKALVAAQRAAGSVGKGAWNDYHKYKYASAEAVIEEARHALNDAGLALMHVGWVSHPAIAGDHPHPRVEVHYRLLHEDGVALDFKASSYVIPEKGRPPDKAEAGALTTNLSYVLRTLLLLPREEEGTSPDTRDDREYSPAKARPAAAASNPAAQAEAPRTPADVGPTIAKIEAAKTPEALAALKPEIQQVWAETNKAGTERLTAASYLASIRVAKDEAALDEAALKAIKKGVDEAQVRAAHTFRAEQLAVAPLYEPSTTDPRSDGRAAPFTQPSSYQLGAYAANGRERAQQRLDAALADGPKEPAPASPPAPVTAPAPQQTTAPSGPPPAAVPKPTTQEPRAHTPPPPAPPRAPRRAAVPF